MKRILVVDDESQITRMLRASLGSSGYAVTVASQGLEAFRAFEAQRPGLIITDLAMPEMNGLELTQAVRRVTQTPIIVLSVRDTEVMKVKALDEGADDYLTNPSACRNCWRGCARNCAGPRNPRPRRRAWRLAIS